MGVSPYKDFNIAFDILKSMQIAANSIRTDAIIDEICERLSTGSNLLQICRDNHMPDRATVSRWQANDEELATRIARARDIGQDYSIDECREIADLATPEDVNVAKLRIFARQWEASKRARKRYGDRTVVEGDSENPVEMIVRKVGSKA